MLGINTTRLWKFSSSSEVSFHLAGVNIESSKEQRDEVHDALDAFFGEESERFWRQRSGGVNIFLEKLHQGYKELRCYRNGYHPLQELTLGLELVKVRVPRESKATFDTLSPRRGFQVQIGRRYQRASDTTKKRWSL
jgi:hypothetical protein